MICNFFFVLFSTLLILYDEQDPLHDQKENQAFFKCWRRGQSRLQEGAVRGSLKLIKNRCKLHLSIASCMPASWLGPHF